MKRRCLFAALLLVGPAAAVHAGHEELKPADFPTRPIEMVVVYPAGGGMDITARTLAREREKLLPVDIVVVNCTGGAGLVGHTYLANQAAPDGYTIAMLAIRGCSPTSFCARRPSTTPPSSPSTL